MKAVYYILSLILFAACNQNKKIANSNDYNAFLKPGFVQREINNTKQELAFWQKRLDADTGNYLNMKELARYHAQLFKLTGNVNELKTADSMLLKSSKKINDKEPAVLYALSQNSITQHKFRDAYNYNLAAEQLNSDPYVNHLLHFDAAMELGKYYEASKKLSNLRNTDAFDFLIRKAKLEDHNGNLENAIELMEKAVMLMKGKRKSNYLWALSNLADMYGHAGKINDAYNAYLKVLREDSANLYCLKGIAWIAYAHDKNPYEAKRILHYIQSLTNMPDLYLMLAEIAEWEGDDLKKDENLKMFLNVVEKPGYDAMYNKYLIHLFIEEYKQYDKALVIAEKEISSRPTPETYDWLAWVYFNMGEKEKAFEIYNRYVYGKTFEPDAVMHTVFVFAENGKKEEAIKLLNECLESSFELGPVTSKKIREKLESMR